MARLTRGAVRFALVLGALIAPACVGNDPTAATSATGDDGGTTPTPTPPPSDGGGNGDAGPLTCPKDRGDCDDDPTTGCEASLLTPDNCGTCGHACGGAATCNQGVCTVETLSNNLDHPFGFAVGGQRGIWLSPSEVYGCTLDSCSASTAVMDDIDLTVPNTLVPGSIYSARQVVIDGANFYYEKCSPQGFDCGPAQCPLTGCKEGGSLPPAIPLVTNSGFRRAEIVFGGPGAVYTWHSLDGLWRFSIPAPSTNTAPSFFIGDFFGGAHVDATSFVFIDDDPNTADPNGGLFVCPATGCVGSRGNTLLAPPIRLMTFGSGMAITTSGKSTDLPSASIFACAISGCGGAGATLAQKQAYISDILADDKDVFWSTVGAPSPTTNAAPVGTIMRCSLPACAGGPEKIADQVVNPVSLQVDGDYVYWITYGTGANKDGTLARRRR